MSTLSGQVVQKLLDEGLFRLANRELETAEFEFEHAYRLASANNLLELGFRSAALVGCVEIQKGRPEDAVRWLKLAAQSRELQDRPSWASALAAVLCFAEAGASARTADLQIARTRARLLEEMKRLDTDLNDATRALKGALHQHGNSRPALSTSLGEVTDSPDAIQRQEIIAMSLGRFKAELLDGRAIRLCRNRKGQAVFKLFVTHPDIRLHKEELLSLLWPDEDPAVAAGKLHISISRLRQALKKSGIGLEPLLLEDDSYLLSRNLSVRSDVEIFEAHVRRGRRYERLGQVEPALTEFQAAADCYGGPYLAEVVGEDWPLPRRTRLEDEHLHVLSKLAHWYEDREEYPRSSECCRKILEIDELREDIYRVLMRIFARGGQRNRALRMFHDLEKLLMKELGVAPMEKTTQYYLRIRNEETV